MIINHHHHHHHQHHHHHHYQNHLSPDQFRAAEEILWHLTHHCVCHEHVDVLGPPDPHQLGDGVEKGEASVRQVVYQDDLQYIDIQSQSLSDKCPSVSSYNYLISSFIRLTVSICLSGLISARSDQSR